MTGGLSLETAGDILTIMNFEELERRARDSNKSVRAYIDTLSIHPLLGWAYPLNLAQPGAQTSNDATLLLLGDSVTWGQDAEKGKNDFATLLGSHLASQNIRLVNAAISGYGLDQMYLRLLTCLEIGKPRLAVFCIIPHDIRRLALSHFITLSKPRFIQNASGTKLELPDLFGTYESYRSARDNYWLGFWYLHQFYDKKEYNYPDIFIGYYDGILHYLLRNILQLSSERGFKVLFVSLPNYADKKSSEILSPLLQNIITKEYENSNIKYIDIEQCVRSLLLEAHSDFSEFEGLHPGAKGHALIAKCLENYLDSSEAIH
jgi:lysophospholipase L1-like esterase